MEEVKANAEEITDLRKQFVAQEKEYRASSAEVVQLKSKIGRKKNNLVVERNRVKLLGFGVVVLWVFISLLSIVIAKNVGGKRNRFLFCVLVGFLQLSS